MARSGVERAASPFHVEPAGGRLYIPTDYFGTVSVSASILDFVAYVWYNLNVMTEGCLLAIARWLANSCGLHGGGILS